ncbi:MAG: RHS repeat protein [Terriglobia bacterium]
MTQITFPTGGTLSYVWTTLFGNTQSSRVISTRTLNANDGSGGHTSSYTIPADGAGTAYVTDPLGNDSVYIITKIGGGPSPYVTQAQYYQGSHTSGTLQKTVTTDYSSISDPYVWCGGASASAFNVVPIRVTTTWPGGKVSKIENDYDSGFTWHDLNFNSTSTYAGTYADVTALREYDYGSGAPGPLLRQTFTNYMALVNSSYQTYNLIDLPYTVVVADGNGTTKAYTYYSYDEYGLQSSGISMQRDPSPPNGNTRGNPTSVNRWLNTTGSYLTNSNTFYDTGTVQVSRDPNLNPTTFAYSSNFAGAYPTTVTNALNQNTYFNFDFNAGLRTSVTDPNSQTTSYGYDNMQRLTQVNYPDGGQTTFNYNDASAPYSVLITKKLNSSSNLTATALVDGVGRV